MIFECIDNRGTRDLLNVILKKYFKVSVRFRFS